MRTRTVVLLLAGGALAAACDSGPTHLSGDPDGDDARDTAEADVAPDAEADGDDDAAGPDADVAPDADGGPDVVCPACTNAPPDSPAGAACPGGVECDPEFDCWPETIDVYDGRAYVSWPDGYCASWGTGTSVCDPYEPRSCPRGASCVALGEGVGGASHGCLDLCAPAGSDGVPWDTNCGCRPGYACDLGSELCLSGCSNDRECCEVWMDENGNGRRNAGEVVALDAARCTDVCDPCTYACSLDGCPGGDCRIGDPCEHDSDCPAGTQCWSEAYGGADVVPGGLCISLRCDLVGRECAAGSGCVDLGSAWDPYYVCVVPCTPGTDPGDVDYPCRDGAPAGPSAGDYACMPTDAASWYDGTTAAGYCWAGNYPGGDGAIGTACIASADCVSPHGLGLCGDWAGPGFCTVMCNRETAAGGICEIDPSATEATGACYYSICLEACETPGGALGANGCAHARLACYDSRVFGAYVWVAAGRSRPAGVCYPACTSDAECAESWGPGATCDRTSGVCG